ncbi:hypothetical protein [Streptomyces flaveolus]|uniref:hypothetical protein n=1 Tax=Streptomyces flaveolus TaxID=67297 RepID=UPI0036F72D91
MDAVAELLQELREAEAETANAFPAGPMPERDVSVVVRFRADDVHPETNVLASHGGSVGSSVA